MFEHFERGDDDVVGWITRYEDYQESVEGNRLVELDETSGVLSDFCEHGKNVCSGSLRWRWFEWWDVLGIWDFSSALPYRSPPTLTKRSDQVGEDRLNGIFPRPPHFQSDFECIYESAMPDVYCLYLPTTTGTTAASNNPDRNA